ncbi:MAG: hypothetical protein WC878_00440 [Candidatus Paceibacterota bacterium]|jgi:hypothetical protein
MKTKEGGLSTHLIFITAKYCYTLYDGVQTAFLMKQYLPSKKFFIVVLSFALLSGGVFWYRSHQKKIALEREKSALEKIKTFAESNKDIDTDGDGLLDWEEAIWSTDYKKADTDGDGTPDGKEIEERRDPLTAGPNDYVRVIGNADQTITTSKEELTESEKLMRGMLTAIMYSSDPLNKEFAENVSKEIADTINTKGKTLPNTYNLSQIKTTAETPENLKLYGNAVGKILSTSEEIEKNDRAIRLITATGLQKKQNDIFDGFDPFIKDDRAEVSALLKVSVPKETATLHLSLVNGTENVAFSLENMKFLVSDSLRGLIAINQYKTAFAARESARQKIREHLSNSGIVFSEEETGSRI